jgi:hypothetical protein
VLDEPEQVGSGAGHREPDLAIVEPVELGQQLLALAAEVSVEDLLLAAAVDALPIVVHPGDGSSRPRQLSAARRPGAPGLEAVEDEAEQVMSALLLGAGALVGGHRDSGNESHDLIDVDVWADGASTLGAVEQLRTSIAQQLTRRLDRWCARTIGREVVER